MCVILQLTACPDGQCRLPAEIVDRFVLSSSDGPIEHARVVCVGHHVYTVPVSRLSLSEGVGS